MAKLFHCLLFAFALVAITETYVEADCICTRDIGPCNPQCDETCTGRYSGGMSSGACRNGSCRCFYECGKEKRCNIGLGYCSSKCNADCCAANCAAEGPDSQGICISVGSSEISVCQCSYDCS